MGVDCILFDLGNVLLFHNSRRRLQALATFSGRSEAAVETFLERTGAIEQLDLGLIDEAELGAMLGSFAQKSLSGPEAVAYWLSVFTPNLGLWDRLPRLAQRHSLGIFSNNPSFVRQLFSKSVRFDHVFLSSQFGVMKPDIKVFEAVQAALALDPARILFIDDKRENTDQALAMGWNAIEFRSNAELERDFARLGL